MSTVHSQVTVTCHNFLNSYYSPPNCPSVALIIMCHQNTFQCRQEIPPPPDRSHNLWIEKADPLGEKVSVYFL